MTRAFLAILVSAAALAWWTSAGADGSAAEGRLRARPAPPTAAIATRGTPAGPDDDRTRRDAVHPAEYRVAAIGAAAADAPRRRQQRAQRVVHVSDGREPRRRGAGARFAARHLGRRWRHLRARRRLHRHGAAHTFSASPWIRPAWPSAASPTARSYALSLGLANGDLFTHVIAFSPGFITPAPPSGRPPIFVSHGTADQVLADRRHQPPDRAAVAERRLHGDLSRVRRPAYRTRLQSLAKRWSG